MRVVAVDLAAKFSAALEMDRDGQVRAQIDSWGSSEDQWITAVTAPWAFPDPPDALVVEDLPHRVPFMTVTKQVCRMQGRIADRMHGFHAINAVRFAPPNLWRGYFELKNGTGADAVVRVAGLNGYTPPDLTHRITRAGDKAIARKVATDYCAAFLIASWFVDFYDITGEDIAVPGTSGYHDPPARRRPRRKETSRAKA